MIQKNVFDEVSCTEANKPKLGLNFKRVQFLAQTNKAVNMLSYFEQPRRSLHVFLSSQNESVANKTCLGACHAAVERNHAYLTTMLQIGLVSVRVHVCAKA